MTLRLGGEIYQKYYEFVQLLCTNSKYAIMAVVIIHLRPQNGSNLSDEQNTLRSSNMVAVDAKPRGKTLF